MQRRHLHVLAVITVAALTSCAGPEPSTRSGSDRPSTAASGSVSGAASPTAESGSVDEQCGPMPSMTDDANAAFGAAAIMDAYCEMVDYTFTTTFPPRLVRPREQREPEEFAFALEGMTQRLQREWKANVEAAVAGDVDAENEVRRLVFYDIIANDRSFRRDEPPVLGQKLSWGRASMAPRANDDRLKMRIQIKGRFNFYDGDQRYEIPIVMRKTYLLQPNTESEPAWLIDDYSAVWKTGESRRVGPLP